MPVTRLPRACSPTAATCVAVWLLLLCLSCMPAAQAHEPDSNQCKYAGIDRAQVLPEAMFGIRLPPFGKVCFLARRTPLPGDPDHSKIIGFELWHEGSLVYRLPAPDEDLWPPACDGIRAVAFPARGSLRDIIVIGNCLGARDEQAQPLVYRARSGGFTLDTELSTDLMGVDTVHEVERRMHRAEAKDQAGSDDPVNRAARLQPRI